MQDNGKRATDLYMLRRLPALSRAQGSHQLHIEGISLDVSFGIPLVRCEVRPAGTART